MTAQNLKKVAAILLEGCFQLNLEHERELQALATARFVEDRVGESNLFGARGMLMSE